MTQYPVDVLIIQNCCDISPQIQTEIISTKEWRRP